MGEQQETSKVDDMGTQEEFYAPRDSFSSFHSAHSEPARSEKGAKAATVLNEQAAAGVDKSWKDFNRESSLNSRISEEAKLEGRLGVRRLWRKFTSSENPEVAKATVAMGKSSQGVSKEKIVEPNIVPYWKLYRYADSLDYLLIFLGFLGSVIHGALVPMNLYVFGRIINSFGGHQNDPSYAVSQVSKFAFVLFIISVNSLWVTWLEVACWMQTGERQSCRLRSKYIEAILSQEIGFFDTSMSTGDVVSSISTDTLMVQEAIGEKVGMYLHHMATFGAGIIVAIISCWQLALLTLVSVPLLLVTGVIYGSIYKSLITRGHIKQLAAGSVIEQAIAQIRTVYAYVGENRAVATFLESAQEGTRVETLAGLAKGVGVGATLGIINLSWALGIWFGSTLIISDNIDGGHVVTSLYCILFAGMSLGQATPELQVFTKGRVAASRIYNVLERVPRISSDPACGQVIKNVKGNFQFDNVVFSYPSRPQALIFNGLSFAVNAGEHVALVGGSGSGKSTVLALIERFYDPTSGQVKLDGNNIQALQLRWLRTKIGLVSQEPALFATSIYENILYGNSDATRQNVEAAARAAHAHDFINKLPGSYDTFVGDRGVQLSGGQKQRIAVARAVLKNPSILLLDEATSALDSESESAVQDGLDMLMLNRTTITIAHRFSTIQNADRILVFSNGKIVEAGTHKDLLQRGQDGVYFSLVHLQGKATEETSQDKRVTAVTYLPGLEKDFFGSPRLSTDMLLDTNQASTPEGSECGNRYGTPSAILGIPSPVSWGLTDPSPLKFSPRAFTPSRGSSSFATPVGTPRTLSESMPGWYQDRKHLDKADRGGDMGHSSFKASVLWHLGGAILPEWLSLLAGSIGALVSGTLNPLFAYFMIKAIVYYYETSHSEMRKQVDEMSLVIMVLGVAAVVSNALQHYNFSRAGEMVSQRLKQKTFEGVLSNEVGWFDREENSSTMVAARILSNAQLVSNAVADRVPSFIQCATAIVIALAISFSLQWRMALLCLGTFPIVMAGGSIKQQFQKSGFAGNLSLSFGKAGAVAGEAVRNIRTVASFGAEGKMLALFNSQLAEHKQSIFLASQKGGFLFGVSQWALFAGNALALWYASVLVKQRHATFAVVLQTFQILVWTGYFLAEVLSIVPDLSKGHKAAASIFKTMHRVSQIDPDNPDGKKLEMVQGQLEFSRVTFHFPCRPGVTVLQNLDLQILAGSTHALVGSSGSGKSTLLSLVLRFYDTVGGRVLVDGTDIKTLNLRWWRQQIGLVQQEPVLFHGSIRMNILYGNDKATEAEVVAAAKLANAYGFISSLPNGFDTEVGEQGVQLSGGQKQRVAIARAVLKNPPIMLLDEATSALDTESERIVQEALNNIMQAGRTTIVIAHRLSSIRHADKITVMDLGKVVEEGTHDALISVGGVYAKLCTLQRLVS